jgi:adenine-specific DNA-methyltransferase
MSINNNPYDFLNTPALDAMRKLQETGALTAALKMETTGAFAAVRELQSTLNAVKSSMGGATAALEEYRRTVAPISESIKAMNFAYAPIFEQTKAFDTLNIKGIISGLQTSASAMSAISGLNLSGIASIIDALPKYDFLSDMVTDDFSVDAAEKLYESGEITQDDINEEITEIVNKKQFSPKAEWDKIKKSMWFIAIKILIIITTFVCNPVTEYATDKALDKLGINEFWEDSGVYDLIDSIFGESEDSTVSETEAKETVDKTKTGNVSKQRREGLLAKIKDIRTFISSAPQDENTANLLSYLSDLEKDVNGKKYGLVFEEHREEIDEVLATHTPVLTEQSDLYIDNGGEMNFLIEGDNLASLQLLEKTHKGKIDLIYIDPPYNTMSTGFTYSDALVDNGDNYRHSKWTSFMKHRLELARTLLSPTGCIFISIDDNEFAALKLICDEVFGWQNFVTTCMWQKIHSIKNDAKYISVNHDFIFVYAKNIDLLKFNLLDRTDEMNSRYKNPDNDPRGPWQSGDLVANEVRTNGNYDVIGPTGKIFNVPEGKHWVYSEDNMRTLIAENRIWFGKNGTSFPRKKRYLSEVQQGRTPDSWWTSAEVGHNQEGARELKSIFDGKVVFTNPKPTRLIERIIKMGSKDNSIILDFFAGSGTLGHAVLKYNASNEHSNRRFILCTNNENNICRDVTYERIKRVIDKENYEASLKYYKVDYVPINERMYYEYADDLLKHIRELVELENGVNFTGNDEIGIVLTEEELDEFIANTDAFTKCRKLYMGHDLLPSVEQEQILSTRGIEISIIPDYYYRDLQEGKE